MSELYDCEIRGFILGFMGERLALKGYSTKDMTDDFDMLIRGVIDSLDFLELTVTLQEIFEVEIDFDEIDPEELSIVGPLCQYITRKKKERPITING